jgi:hypothetical protein
MVRLYHTTSAITTRGLIRVDGAVIGARASVRSIVSILSFRPTRRTSRFSRRRARNENYAKRHAVPSVTARKAGEHLLGKYFLQPGERSFVLLILGHIIPR